MLRWLLSWLSLAAAEAASWLLVFEEEEEGPEITCGAAAARESGVEDAGAGEEANADCGR